MMRYIINTRKENQMLYSCARAHCMYFYAMNTITCIGGTYMYKQTRL